jgi:hypothetical protein
MGVGVCQAGFVGVGRGGLRPLAERSRPGARPAAAKKKEATGQQGAGRPRWRRGDDGP